MQTPGAASASYAQGSAVFSIPTTSAASLARLAKHRAFLSPSTASVALSVTGIAAPVIVDVSATSSACTATSGTRTCTIGFGAPLGSDTITATLYTGAGGSGNILGVGSTSLTIASAERFSVSLDVSGMASSANIAVARAIFTAGTAATTSVTFEARDAGGNTIEGAYAMPITLTDSDTTGTFTISPTTISNSTTPITLKYSGGAAATSATLSAHGASASALASVSAAVVTVGTGTPPPPTPATPTPATPPPATPPPATTPLNLYVADIGSNAFTVTPITANGNVAPVRMVSGSDDQLDNPYGIALDGSENTYVSNLSGGTIDVFAAGANGSTVAPMRTISGLSAPIGLGFDAGGNLYAANFSGGSIEVFAPGASGAATPIRTISGSNTGIADAYGLTLDSAGNVYLVNDMSQFGGVDSVMVYAAMANGNVAPTRTITGSLTGMGGAVFVAVDAASDIWVSNAYQNSVTEYAPNANGNVMPIATLTNGISYPAGIVFDSAGRLYVVTDRADSIVVFAAGATSSSSPIATISGSNTGLSGPDAVTIGP